MNMSQLKRRLGVRSVSWRDCIMLALGVIVTLAGMATASFIHDTQTPLPYRPEGVTARWIPPSVRRWDGIIAEMGKKYNVDPNLIAIIITMESGGYARAESEAGAKGLMQVTGPTSQDIAAKFLKEPRTSYDLMNPRTNIEFGTAYLAYLRDEFGTAKQGPEWTATVELIAAGYNGGPGTASALEKGEGLRDPQPVIYSRDAFNMWRERRAQKSPTFERWAERGGSRLLDAANAGHQ
ncbi:MAG TPA: lytic transglycosylase domain-containing protein [Candidatus Saccharimonadales bacterium]